ncbi:MAG: SCO family protein [Betaproteobacteria bacterium]
MKRALPWIFALVAGLLVVLAGFALRWPSAPAPGSGGDFALQTQDGPISLAGLRGKVVLLYFGYTYCPDVCPTALTSYGAALRRLSPETLERVAVVFVSVDPERDTLPHLKEYAAFFHPKIIGATGTPTQIQTIARQYGVFYVKRAVNESGNYSVDHTSESYLIAPDGHLAERLPHGASPEVLATAIQRWLP